MPIGRVVVLACFLALPLAGCVEEEAAEVLDRGDVGAAGVDGTGLDPALLDPGALPEWREGDWWTLTGRSIESGETNRVVLVVTEARPDAYVLQTTEETMALYDAVFDISYVGPITRANLAGRQGDTPVEFFRFPLEDGASWTTEWDGLEVTITVAAVSSLSTPLGTAPGFEFTAMAGNTTHATYEYSPLTRWFTRITFTDGYEMTLVDAGSNFTGTVLESEGGILAQHTFGVLGGGHGGGFTVRPDATHVGYAYDLDAASATYHLAFVEPDGETTRIGPERCAPCRESGMNPLAAEPGPWQFSHELVSDSRDADGSLLVYEAAIVERPYPASPDGGDADADAS